MSRDVYFKDGYVYYEDDDEPVINKDGTHRRAPGRPTISVEDREAQKALAIAQREKDREAITKYKKEIDSRDLLKQLNKREFDVVGRLMDIVDDVDTPQNHRVNILLKMFDMAYPKLTSMNLNSENKDNMVFNIQIGGSTPRTIDVTPSEKE